MSAETDIEECSFAIAPDKETDAQLALAGQFGAWIEECDCLDDAVERLGFVLERDGDGRVCRVFKENLLFGDDDEFFEALGPHVRRGSFVVMHGGVDDERWTYRFTGRRCIVETAEDLGEEEEDEDGLYEDLGPTDPEYDEGELDFDVD